MGPIRDSTSASHLSVSVRNRSSSMANPASGDVYKRQMYGRQRIGPANLLKFYIYLIKIHFIFNSHNGIL